MKQQSALQVTVRGTVIGGSKSLICLPLMGESKTELIEEATTSVGFSPDLLEWRIDAYEMVDNIEDCLVTLKELRLAIGEMPLIVTCRIDREGGLRTMAQNKRLELFIGVIESGDADIVDIELCNEEEFIRAIRIHAKVHGVRLILSYHNFTETPSESFIYAKLVEAQKVGADISKLAVMPQDYGDVLTLLSATHKARNEAVQVPMVTISMGAEGGISRLAGGLFGSDITFAVGLQSSAPGQIPIGDLEVAMALLDCR